MNRRTLTLLTALASLLTCGVLLIAVPVPFVSLGPGPTFDTLGELDGQQIVEIEGTESHPTTGHLNMTTVSQQDGLSLGAALALWLSRREQLLPRDVVYPPGKTRQEIDKSNSTDFKQSEQNAEYAALGYLQYSPEITVADVQSDGPSAQNLQVGDALDAINGVPVSTVEQFSAAMAATQPGDILTVDYRRKNSPPGIVRIKLGQKEGHQNGFLGIGVVDAPWAPFSITFNLANIGGPSAGLMFSLAVVDKLTDGDLAGSHFIAGTGTISPDGTVGPIGGIKYKMTAAQEAGATVFLVPEENCHEALASHHHLRLIKVTSLAQAIDSLHTLKQDGQPPSC